MAILAVDKDGTEIISDYDIYRNGFKRHYMTCANSEKCAKCLNRNCKTDELGRKYRTEVYNYPPKMNKDKAITELHFWDNFEFDPDGNKISFIISLPKGIIKKLIDRELTWEDEPVELNYEN